MRSFSLMLKVMSLKSGCPLNSTVTPSTAIMTLFKKEPQI
jgi:hypothetical protein